MLRIHQVRRWFCIFVILALVLTTLARPTASFAQTPRFSTGTHNVVLRSDTLFVSIPIINSGTGSALNIQVTSITLNSGNSLVNTTLPISLGAMLPGANLTVDATFDNAGLMVGSKKLLTVRGTYDVGSATFGFALNRYITIPETISSEENPLEQLLSPGAVSLVGLSLSTFNPQSSPLVFTLSESVFYQSPAEVVLKVNGSPVPLSRLTIEPHTITATSALVDGRNDISLTAVDTVGRPLYYNTTLWAGSHTLRIALIDVNGLPFMEAVDVLVSLGDDQSVFARASTSNGSVQFQNIPFRTILIQATASANRFGLIGAIGTQGVAQVRMLGFNLPSTINNNDFSQGTAGWDVANAPVQIVPHVEGLPGQIKPTVVKTRQPSHQSVPPPMPAVRWPKLHEVHRKIPASSIIDNDMVINTQGQGERSVKRSFSTTSGTSSVQIRYRFITSEVPGGYFGSQYNDYFRVSLRSKQGGGSAVEANSMNGLGLGAFDFNSGATAWRDVTLKVNPEGDVIQVDVGVANVADGLLDSRVVIDFVKEVKDQVKPSLAWNSTQGGMNLSFRVENGELAQATTINVYWAKGSGFTGRIGSSIFSYTVPSGTPEDQYGPIHIDGSDLAADPTGATHLIAASSETSVGALADVRIVYGAQANAAVVRASMIDIIKDSLRAAGQSSATITSTARTPDDQARAMFQNLTKDRNGDGQLTLQEIAQNINVQHNGDGTWNGYAAAGDAVINVFEQRIVGLTPAQVLSSQGTIRAAMVQEINQQGPGKVSKHCADPTQISVVDIAANAFNNSNRSLFVSAAQSRVSRFIDERSTNGCYHLEVQ